MQLLIFEHAAELIAQDRQQHLATQGFLGRAPVDVEEAGVLRRGSVFQHVLPPAVMRVVDAHVVGHDVDDQPQPLVAQCLGKGVKLLFGAQLRVELAMIDNVVAVAAAGAGTKEGGEIRGSDAEIRHVADQSTRGIEGQMPTKLQPIGGNGNRRRRQAHKYSMFPIAGLFAIPQGFVYPTWSNSMQRGSPPARGRRSTGLVIVGSAAWAFAHLHSSLGRVATHDSNLPHGWRAADNGPALPRPTRISGARIATQAVHCNASSLQRAHRNSRFASFSGTARFAITP